MAIQRQIPFEAIAGSVGRALAVSFVAAAVLASAGLASGVRAAEFERGGYAPAESFEFGDEGQSFRFTPRIFATTGERGAEHWGRGFGAAGDLDVAGEVLGFGGQSPFRGQQSSFGDDRGGFVVGGEMARGEWRFAGSFARSDLGARELDLLSAGLGYGSVRASLGVGSSALRDGGEESGLFVMSAGIDALPWLEVGGDVALLSPERDDRGMDAAGRLTFRLNF